MNSTNALKGESLVYFSLRNLLDNINEALQHNTNLIDSAGNHCRTLLGKPDSEESLDLGGNSRQDHVKSCLEEFYDRLLYNNSKLSLINETLNIEL